MELSFSDCVTAAIYFGEAVGYAVQAAAKILIAEQAALRLGPNMIRGERAAVKLAIAATLISVLSDIHRGGNAIRSGQIYAANCCNMSNKDKEKELLEGNGRNEEKNAGTGGEN